VGAAAGAGVGAGAGAGAGAAQLGTIKPTANNNASEINNILFFTYLPPSKIWEALCVKILFLESYHLPCLRLPSCPST